MIIFIRQPSDSVLNAFNNNVYVFESDIEDTYNYCTVTCNVGIGIDIVLEITPINNVFYFNTKEVLSLASFKSRFKDINRPILGFETDADFVKTATITFEMVGEFFTDTEEVSFSFTRSVQQINEDNTKSGFYILNNPYLTFFKGFPFDFGMNVANPILTNETNGKFLNSATTTNQRLFLSDGQNIVSNNSQFEKRVLTLSEGFLVDGCQEDFGAFLNVGFNQILLANDFNELEITINLKDICDGVYLKWINEFGTWSYWLFSRINKTELATSTQGFYSVDYLDITQTRTVELSTGKKAQNTIKLNAQNLNENEMSQVKSIFTSPRVELYNGAYGELNDIVDFDGFWQTVQVSDGTFLTQQTKRDLINVSFDIKKNRYTQT